MRLTGLQGDNPLLGLYSESQDKEQLYNIPVTHNYAKIIKAC